MTCEKSRSDDIVIVRVCRCHDNLSTFLDEIVPGVKNYREKTPGAI